MKKILLFALLSIAAINVKAQIISTEFSFEFDGIYYASCHDPMSPDIISVAVCHNPYKYIGDIAIPSSVTYKGNTYSVTAIDVHAFTDCTGLTSVVIPNSITNIWYDAFWGCTSLKSVTWNVKKLNSQISPFAYNEAITSFVFGDEVESILGGLCCGLTGLTSVNIPNSVTAIEGFAFEDCSGLASVTIGGSVTSIGEHAFKGCTGLPSVTIPNLVTSIGESAFEDCTGLTSVTIPNLVTSIGENALKGCSGLNSIIVKGGNTKYDSRNNCNAIIETETNKLLEGCKNTTIPNSVTSIGESAFEDCTGLTSVTIPNLVTSIGKSAFEGCTGLNSIIVKGGNTKYDSRNNCNAIIETETNKLLIGCKNTIIPNSVTSIGDSAFSRCTGLTSVTIPNSVIEIGNYAFSRCTGLTSVTIPNSVRWIGDFIFSSCTNLSSIYSKIQQPQNVDFKLHGAVPFINVYSTACLYVPMGTLSLYQSTFPWSGFSHIVEVNYAIDGDVNCDGNVTAADVTEIYNNLLNNDDTYIETCDVNGDAIVTAADITALYNILLEN